jgi:hypothetical protein
LFAPSLRLMHTQITGVRSHVLSLSKLSDKADRGPGSGDLDKNNPNFKRRAKHAGGSGGPGLGDLDKKY